MHGHTGATMSIGTGSIFGGSWKQKMVSHSSTESDTVGVYDVLPHVLWMKKILEGQGFTVKETVLYHNNMNSVLLKKNRKQLSLKQMKHMDIQFLYVMEHVQNTTLSMKHCPTEEMVPDFSIKLLEGLLFVKLCNFIKRAEYADPEFQTQRGVLDEDDGSWHLEADPEAENLEA